MDTAGGRQKGTAIVADDQRDVRGYVSDLLAGEGYSVIPVDCGAEVLKTLQSHSCTLLVTDIFMDNGDGVETIQEIRKRDLDLQIVVMTGSAEYKLYLGLASTLGASATIRKPFSPTEFRKVLAAVSVCG